MGTSPHIMIVESRYYELIAEELINSVLHELNTAGATYERFEVPGAVSYTHLTLPTKA